MATLFLDSSGWFAALAPRQEGHALARQSYVEAATGGALLVTTMFVVAEMHTLLLRWRGPDAAQSFLEVALDGTSHTIIDVGAELVAAAVSRWIRGYRDQPFSLCDAISFEVMRRERIAGALTYDNHFVVAGYQILSTQKR